MSDRLSRRSFIKVVSTAGGGLLLASQLHFGKKSLMAQQLQAGGFSPNIWIKIDRQGIVTITVVRSEMGQGIRTSFAMIIADELEAPIESIRLEFPIADPKKYGDMTTRGGTSIKDFFIPLRQAAATAREMLIAAAADIWKVSASQCRAEKGYVLHPSTAQKIAYGELADKASTMPVPDHPPIKDTKDFRYIGKAMKRIEALEIASGSIQYGIDMTIPELLIATIIRPPVFGATVVNFDATSVLTFPGMKPPILIPSGIALIGSDTWTVMKSRESVKVEWDNSTNQELSSEAFRKQFGDKLGAPTTVSRFQGNPSTSLLLASKRVEARYEVPFAAHAQMEPLNCIANFKENDIEIWAPTQSPQAVQKAVADFTKVPIKNIKVHTTLMGGSFGRGLLTDFVLEAVQVSQNINAPIKLIWTREDNFQHDYFRPASLHQMAAGIEKGNTVNTWVHKIVAPSIQEQVGNDQNPNVPDVVDGAANFMYDSFPNISVEYFRVPTAIPVGWWRSVYNSNNAFANECFLDEIAIAIRLDPVEFRRRLLPDEHRMRKVLEYAVTKAAWWRQLQKNEGHGFACHACYGSYVATIADVSISADNKLKVQRIVTAIDCGQVINPLFVEEQIESAVAFAISATIFDEIVVDKGSVVQKNFDSYRILSQNEMPVIETSIVPSTEPPGGVSETGVPTVAPAICNAIYNAIKKRIRRLPIKPEDLIQQ